MFIKVYVPGAPLYEKDSISKKDKVVGRSIDAFRDPCTNGRTIPVFLRGEEIGQATRMKKIEDHEEPCLCFDTEFRVELHFNVKFDGLLASIKGVMWTNGLHPRELHLEVH